MFPQYISPAWCHAVWRGLHCHHCGMRRLQPATAGTHFSSMATQWPPAIFGQTPTFALSCPRHSHVHAKENKYDVRNCGVGVPSQSPQLRGFLSFSRKNSEMLSCFLGFSSPQLRGFLSYSRKITAPLLVLVCPYQKGRLGSRAAQPKGFGVSLSKASSIVI